MALLAPEIGKRSPLPFRYGPGVPVRGMRRRGDPGACPFPYWWLLINCRFDDGFGDRGGAGAFLETGGGSSTDEVISLFDFQQVSGGSTRNKLFVVIDGCPGISSVAGASLNWFDQNAASPFGRGPYDGTATVDPVLGFYDGRMYVGADDKLKVFTPIEPDREDEILDIAGFDQTEVLRVFTGFTIKFLRSAFGYLFIGLDGGAGASKIVRYDGITFEDDDTAIDPPTVASLFRDEYLVAGLSTGGLRVRTAAGAWSTVASAAVPNAMREYRDNLWFTASGTTLYKFDSAAITAARVVAGATMLSLATAFGNLYYGYSAGAAGAIIGRLDAAGAYVDAHKSFQAQLATATATRQLEFFRGQLIAGVNTGGPSTGSRMFFSPGSDTGNATWEVLQPNVAANGDIVAFAVYEPS